MTCRFIHLAPRPGSPAPSRRCLIALTATTLALLAPGCSGEDDTAPADETGTGGGSDGVDETGSTESGPCTLITQTDLESDLELPAGCYEVEMLLNLDGSSLLMEPGVEVTFAQNAGLMVGQSGVLRAVGGADDPVILKGQTEARGSWVGLRLLGSTSSENRLEHVELRHAGGGSGNAGAVTLSNGARLTVTQSTIADNEGFAISADGAELTLTQSTIEANAAALSVAASSVAGVADDNVFESNDRNVAVVTGGTLAAGATWRAIGIPFHPEANFRVQGPLTLEPGVTIAMAKDASFIVETEGQLQAEATEAAPITFTGQQAEVGFWKGLSVQSKSSGNVLDHCIVEYGGASQWTGASDSRAMIWQPDQSKLTVRNSTLRHSGWYGILANRGSDIAGFEQNHIESNVRAMIVEPNSVGAIAPSNTFENNTEQKVRVVFGNTDPVMTAQTWHALDVPYLVTDRFYIATDLTIEAGTTIEVAQDVRIIVRDEGSIATQGTSDAPVVFTGADTVAGYWMGLQIGTLASSNRLEHTIVDYAGSGNWTGGSDTDAAIYVGANNDGSITLADVTIRNSSGNGIFVASGSSATCNGITFENIAKLDVAGTGTSSC